jgi:hypothetical protein
MEKEERWLLIRSGKEIIKKNFRMIK